MKLKWEQRAVLGEEELTLVNGDKKTVEIRSLGFTEKAAIAKQFKKKEVIKNMVHESVDEPAVMIELLSRALGDQISIHMLNFNDGERIYKKYFQPQEEDEHKKKEETSTT